jgi:hypothetical protein
MYKKWAKEPGLIVHSFKTDTIFSCVLLISLDSNRMTCFVISSFYVYMNWLSDNDTLPEQAMAKCYVRSATYKAISICVQLDQSSDSVPRATISGAVRAHPFWQLRQGGRGERPKVRIYCTHVQRKRSKPKNSNTKVVFVSWLVLGSVHTVQYCSHQ